MNPTKNVTHPGPEPASSARPTPETDDVTVVVATRNRPDRLRQTMRHHRAPVIVVDNGSDQPLDIDGAEVIRLDHNLGAAARNIGAERARTPFVAFADDDSFWAPGSLACAAEVLHACPRTALLAAEVRVGPENRLDPISADMATAPLGTPAGGAGPAVLGFLACAAVVRRDTFLAVGGFNPKLLVYGEEALLAMDLAAAGWQLSYTPHLTVHHHPEPAGRNVRARRRREARNRILTALLRRPPAVVARAVAAGLVTDPTAVASVLPELRWALNDRRRVPESVERALRAIA
ncbi:glycosyltransferase family 2 protein [Paractinoplanes toevensis]|uniref:Glycosyl transferase n=1 Tax=Paractinoplanes toevensis TaxID=571911 RepID=A0A919W6U5_9ACTN|nr:glycosyltransferase [Actinoplanes toevensis]GIM93618.1 glycosyl transferase [Actinoplanes toevensis]